MKHWQKILVEKPEGMMPFGGNLRGWKDNFKLTVEDTRYEVIERLQPP
jgi:hypothetical protein